MFYCFAEDTVFWFPSTRLITLSVDFQCIKKTEKNVWDILYFHFLEYRPILIELRGFVALKHFSYHIMIYLSPLQNENFVTWCSGSAGTNQPFDCSTHPWFIRPSKQEMILAIRNLFEFLMFCFVTPLRFAILKVKETRPMSQMFLHRIEIWDQA